MTLHINLISIKGLILSISCKFENDDSLRWVNFMILKNYLDKIVCYVKWLSYIIMLLYF